MTCVVRAAQRESFLIVDSPHSGTDYPADFGHACSRDRLRCFEDRYVDELVGDAPALGATLLRAVVARTYLDANRSLEDDDALLTQSAAEVTGEKARMGMGLVWRLLDDGTPIYDRPLTHDEIDRRVTACWRPYRSALAKVLEQTHARHGLVVHLNCHSMPSTSPMYPQAWGRSMPFDFVIGNRDDTSAGRGLTLLVHAFLNRQGYRVSVNEPFRGGDLVRRFGQPALGWHSLQIEINKALYMDELTHERNTGFAATRSCLKSLMGTLVATSPRDFN
jgi:N-formylglutamate deformylase